MKNYFKKIIPSIILTIALVIACTIPPAPSGMWKPKPGTSWQWQLTGTVETSLNVVAYDIDFMENDAENVIKTLKAKGVKVIGYFSAGSFEEWRPDARKFPSSVKGKSNGWPGERWLDIRRIDILGPIMEARLDLAVKVGCDAVEPDNVDGYANDTGFPLSKNDQITYNKWLAEQAHKRKLSVALKNTVELVETLEPFFDFAVNEECFSYDECDALLPFIRANKAVLGVQYEMNIDSFCPKANAMNMDFLKKNYDLDAWRIPCRGN